MKSLLIWFVLGQAADLSSTAIGLHQGCREITPILRIQPWVGLEAKTGAVVVSIPLLPRLHRAKPKTAKGLAIVGALSGFAAGAWNTRQILKGCQR